MTTTIYLIRHGEVYNPKGIFYGRLPGDGLSERGIQELISTAGFLRGKSIDQLITSPMLRARQSAEIVQRELGLPTLQIDDRLIEVRTSYQGKLFSELDDLQSEIYRKPLNPNDETMQQVAERMHHFIIEKYKTYPGKTLAAFTHGDPIMILKAIVQNLEPTFENFKIGNGPYARHGEVFKVVIENPETISIERSFKPNVN